MRMARGNQVRLSLGLVWLGLASSLCRADEFQYTDRDGQPQRVHARLAGQGDGFFALELDDGRWKLVAEGALQERIPGPDPTPIRADEMAARLEQRFTKDLFQYRVSGNVVVGIVLMAPLGAENTPKLENFLDRAVSFMESVDSTFGRFASTMQLELTTPRFPQVLLIFEANRDFNAYYEEGTGRKALSSQTVAGFYSALTNWLAIRIDECDSFATPMHEAIHQQVFNRGVLQRLAPVPNWFSEGIANGFENDGNKVRTDATKINRLYAGLLTLGPRLTFDDVITRDETFRGDVFAGDAYSIAWALHWYLVTERPSQYTAFVRRLRTIEPLASREDDDRLAEFQQTFALNTKDLPRLYSNQIQIASRKQRVRIAPPTANVGNIVIQENTGIAELGAVRRVDKGYTQFTGKLKNLSPIRPLTFRVSMTSPGAKPIVWVRQELGAGRSSALEKQYLWGNSGTGSYQVELLSALPESDDARAFRP